MKYIEIVPLDKGQESSDVTVVKQEPVSVNIFVTFRFYPTNTGLQCFDAWRGCLSGVRCRLAYGPADATATHCLLLQ